jgi:hypothetical protein
MSHEAVDSGSIASPPFGSAQGGLLQKTQRLTAREMDAVVGVTWLHTVRTAISAAKNAPRHALRSKLFARRFGASPITQQGESR